MSVTLVLPPAPDYVALDDQTLLGQCEIHTVRGTGPGGQKRNKTESAVRMLHRPTGLLAQSDATRSQHKNRELALRRLRQRLALEIRRPVRLESYAPPPELASYLELRGHVPGRHAGGDLVAVARLLDLFVALECSVSDTAGRLRVSTGLLSKLLLADPALAQTVGALRAARGLRTLR